MLLTITSTHRPATDLGYLLHKNPARCQSFELPFGKAHVFYPEATEERCTAALLLDVDPVGMVKGKSGAPHSGPLDQYVNDRPYVASSFMSVALSRVYGSGMQGTCNKMPELVDKELPLEVRISVLPCRAGGEVFLRKLFEPLGYGVDAERHPLDEQFPEWGEGPYFTVTLRKKSTLKNLLTHLYVLIPVMDHGKHYYVSRDEVEKLLAKGEGWLTSHPQRDQITRRYLKFQPSLARQALERLSEEDEPAAATTDDVEEDETPLQDKQETLHEVRLGTVTAAIKACGARSVLDLGCGEGKLLRALMKVSSIEKIVGMDVSIRALELAQRRLRLDQLAPKVRERINLLHGSLLYRDKRLQGFDAAAVVEVVEHLDPPRLAAFERVVFECARPRTVVLTTPNREYNIMWDLGEDGETGSPKLRHGDHRFEWTRQEFQDWANKIASQFSYRVLFLPIGPEDETVGPPSQMAIFELKEWN